MSARLRPLAATIAEDAATLQARADQAATGRGPAVAAAQDIASAKSTVADKVRAKAEKAQADAKAALDVLHPQSMANEDIGSLIQQRGTENIDALEAARKKAAITDVKDPAFEDARARASKGDFLTTNPESAPIIQKAHQQFLQQIDDMRVTADEKAALVKKADALFSGEPMTLQQGEYLRRLNMDPMTREQVAWVWSCY